MPRAFSSGSLGQGLAPPTPFSRDAYFIVRRPLIEGDHALTVPSRTSDPTPSSAAAAGTCSWCLGAASHPGRRLAQGLPGRSRRLRDRRGRALGLDRRDQLGLSRARPHALTTSPSAVPGWCRSARTTRTRPDLKFAHRSRLVDHGDERGLARAAHADRRALHHRAGRGRRSRRPRLSPAGAEDGALAARDDARAWRRDRRFRGAGARACGTAAGDLSAETSAPWLTITAPRPRLRTWCVRRPGTGPPLPVTAPCWRRDRACGQHEMALTLADAVFRRTDLCTLGHPGEAALRAAAQVMGECLGWDQARRRRRAGSDVRTPVCDWPPRAGRCSRTRRRRISLVCIDATVWHSDLRAACRSP